MTEYKKIYVDTALFIYYLEKNPDYFSKAKKFFIDCIENQITIITSVVTVFEYLVYPYRNNDHTLVRSFEQFLNLMKVKVVEIDIEIAKKAAMIRSKYKGYKGMDSLQLASSLESNCDLFITNDNQLKQTQEVKCITLDDWIR
ncbi:MAG: PIN domain-containing protein [Oscillospiraceae bacterium]|nr:PIN domain-containing protein [Oscillospiraceae bacterium]